MAKKYSLLLALMIFCGCFALAQEPGQTQSLGISFSYAPTSSNILIGHAEDRQTITAGVEYTHPLWANRNIGITYEGSAIPLFVESDPTLIGASSASIIGPPTTAYLSKPVRVLDPNHMPIGYILVGGLTIPIEPLYGSKENTYGVAVSPLGARINGFRRWRAQPTASLDLGAVYTSRDIPVDNTSRFNFMFSFGPGVEIFTSRRSAVRVEYLYRHISNANTGTNNPGIDSGALRLTVSRYH